MKSRIALILLVASLAATAPAQKKPKRPVIPAVFDHARYVYVQAVDGDAFNQKLYPEDRQAIADVESGLRYWGRYSLTVDRSQADLVFVVRKGRLASAHGDVAVIRGSGSQSTQSPGTRGNGTAVGGGAEVGPPDDLLWVCTLDPSGKLSTPLWTGTKENGLTSPDVPLFQEFRGAVDSAYPPKKP
jgi:hypothetical protein